jgi:hypothetical protein
LAGNVRIRAAGVAGSEKVLICRVFQRRKLENELENSGDWPSFDKITDALTTFMHQLSEIEIESTEGEQFPMIVGLIGFESPKLYEK